MPGDRGDAVATWQSDLNRWIAAAGASLAPLAVDGIYGAATTTATKVFQRAQRVTVDGLTGPETRAAMASAPALVNVTPEATTAAATATPPASGQPAAGICSTSDAPVTEVELGVDTANPRCLALSGEHRLRVVNAGVATHVTLGTWVLDLDAGVTATTPFPVRAYVAAGDHVVAVARYGGSGPDVRVR